MIKGVIILNRNQSNSRKIIVAVLLSSTFVAILNQTLLIVAIPPIMDDFHIGPDQAQWITTGFLLMNGIMIPVTAFLIEKFSSKVLLIFSLAIFILGTFIGAIAPNFPILMAARILQASGAGILLPLMQTVMLILFPVERRGAVMGMAGLVIGFAPAIGPTLGGFLIDQFAWRYLFYTVLPIAIIVMIFALFFMKNVTEQKKVNVDTFSIVLSTFGWGGLLYGFSIVGTIGWIDIKFIFSVLVGVISLTLFIKRQNKQEMPMLNFNVFKSKEFTITTCLSVLMFAVLIAAETILPLYVQHVKGGTALQSGAMLLPGALITGFMSPIAGKMFDKSGARGMSIIGFCFILSSTILYLNVGLETPIPYIAVIFLLQMFGMSLLMTPLMTSGINALPTHLIPHGTAMQNTIRMVGASIGTALIVSIMSFTNNASSSMLDGIHAAFIVTVLLAVFGLILSFSLQKKISVKEDNTTVMFKEGK